MASIGAAILRNSVCGKPKVKVRRSKHLMADTGANEIQGGRFLHELDAASVTHLGMVETNEPTGKVSRDTIQIRSTEPLHAAVPQENAEEDIIEYDGALWRVIAVRRLNSTWRATAVRKQGQKEFTKNDSNGSTKQSRLNII